MAPSGKLRRSENLPDEGLVWAAMPCTAFLHPRDPERLYVVIWALSGHAAVRQQGRSDSAPGSSRQMTAVSPKRTQRSWLVPAIADIRCACLELVVCGTKRAFAASAPMSASVDYTLRDVATGEEINPAKAILKAFDFLQLLDCDQER